MVGCPDIDEIGSILGRPHYFCHLWACDIWPNTLEFFVFRRFGHPLFRFTIFGLANITR